MRPWHVITFAIVLFPSSGAMARDCNGVAPEDWLVGTWEALSDVQTLVVRREGDALVWTYVRNAGVTSPKWGDKVPAAGAGKVEALDDCRAVLKGRYTRFDGPGQRGRPAVGSPMEWRMLQTAPGYVASEGFGYGRETFQLPWRKSQQGSPEKP